MTSHSACRVAIWSAIPNSDAYVARGLHDQYIYIDPKNNTVIVKLSYSPSPVGGGADNMVFFQKVAAMLAK